MFLPFLLGMGAPFLRGQQQQQQQQQQILLKIGK